MGVTPVGLACSLQTKNGRRRRLRRFTSNSTPEGPTCPAYLRFLRGCGYVRCFLRTNIRSACGAGMAGVWARLSPQSSQISVPVSIRMRMLAIISALIRRDATLEA